MENDNIESVETNNDNDSVNLDDTSFGILDDAAVRTDNTVELNLTEEDILSDENITESEELESEETLLSDTPVEDMEITVECNCTDNTPLWESDISQYNVTNGLLLLILVALCFNIIMRK